MERNSKVEPGNSEGPPAPNEEAHSSIQEPSETEPTASVKRTASMETREAGRYRLEYCLGKGSFGEVWKAFDPVLNIYVAVKMPRLDRGYSVAISDQFVDEARKQAKLNHSAIVKIRHAERNGTSWLIVSDFIEGKSLRERMAAKRYSPEASALLVADIADALQLAHQARIIHRDVKPANILVDDAGKAFLTDFGIALTEDEQQSQKNMVAGTYAYMSPEQIRGDAHLLDGRSDIFSLGVVLYELLTGERPFRAATMDEFREQLLQRLPKPLRAVDKSIPRELERICLKCLAKNAAERYLTAADLAADLRRSTQPKPWRLVGTALGLVLALAVALSIWRPWLTPVPTPDRNPGAPPDVTSSPKKSHDGWMPLWERNPKKLVWQASGAGGLLEVKDRDEFILAMCDGHGVFKLGEVNEPSYTFRAHVKLVDGRGMFAILLGYRYVLEQGKENAHFEMLRLSENFPGATEKYLLSLYSVSSYSELRGGLATGRPIGHAKIVDLQPRECALEITVADDRLVSVRWDGQLRPELTQTVPPLPNARPRTWQGGICCYVNAATVYVQRPEVKIKKES